MPYYRITVTDIYGKVKQGVRFDDIAGIDAYYQKAHRKAVTTLKNTFKSIEVVMLTSNCTEVLAHLEKERNKPVQNYTPIGYTGKDKIAYRNLTDKKE